MKKHSVLSICVLIAGILPLCVSCKPAPKEAYFNRGAPESLIDLPTQAVNITIHSPVSIQEMTDYINKKRPTRAEIACDHDDTLCKEILRTAKQFAVPVIYSDSGKNRVSLIYEKVMVRNCQNRFIDTTSDLNNVDSPTLGCSVAINMVQMITDKRQILDPQKLGATDATKPLQAVANYNTLTKPDTSFSELVQSAGSSSGGSGGASR